MYQNRNQWSDLESKVAIKILAASNHVPHIIFGAITNSAQKKFLLGNKMS